MGNNIKWDSIQAFTVCVALVLVSGCCSLYEGKDRTTVIGYGRVKSKTGAEGEIKVLPTEVIVK